MKINEKETDKQALEQSFADSVIAAMRLNYELKALKKNIGNELSLEEEDFLLTEKIYTEFIEGLKKYIKDNNLSSNVAKRIQEGVKQINQTQLSEEYSKFIPQLSKDEYRALNLGNHLYNIKRNAEEFVDLYYAYTDGREIAYDNKPLALLKYDKIIRTPLGFLGAFDMWDMNVSLFGKKESISTSDLEIESV